MATPAYTAVVSEFPPQARTLPSLSEATYARRILEVAEAETRQLYIGTEHLLPISHLTCVSYMLKEKLESIMTFTVTAANSEGVIVVAIATHDEAMRKALELRDLGCKIVKIYDAFGNLIKDIIIEPE